MTFSEGTRRLARFLTFSVESDDDASFGSGEHRVKCFVDVLESEALGDELVDGKSLLNVGGAEVTDGLTGVGCREVTAGDGLLLSGEVGGVTPVMRIAEIARAHELELALHCGGNDPFGQHLSTAIADVALAEVYYGADTTGVVSSYRAFAGVAAASDGYVEASDAPGFGFEFDLAAIERSVS